jgi:protein-tyrosine phosphatase
MTGVDPYRICFVSTRDTCRSPMAEAAWPYALGRHSPLAGRVVVESAGISSSHVGEPIDPRARAALVAIGYKPLPEHRARRFMRSWFDRFDLVIAMDMSVQNALHRMAPSPCPVAITLLPDHMEDWTLKVPDPHGGDEADFAACLGLIGQGLHDLTLDIEVHLGFRVDTYPGDGQ